MYAGADEIMYAEAAVAGAYSTETDPVAAAAAAATAAGITPFNSVPSEQLEGHLPADDSSPGDFWQQTTVVTEVPSMAPAAAASGPRVTQRVPMAAGATTIITPAGTTTTMHAGQQAAAPVVAEVLVESPTVSGAGAADVSDDLPSMHVDSQPKVDSPTEDLDAGMGDFLQNLHSMNSAELMMTDDMNKDDLWDMLFGGQQQPSSVAAVAGQGLHPAYDAGGSLLGSGMDTPGGLAGAHYAAGVPGAPLVVNGPAAGLPAVGSPALPGMDHDALDPAMAAALTVPANLPPAAAAGSTSLN